LIWFEFFSVQFSVFAKNGGGAALRPAHTPFPGRAAKIQTAKYAEYAERKTERCIPFFPRISSIPRFIFSAVKMPAGPTAGLAIGGAPVGLPPEGRRPPGDFAFSCHHGRMFTR
jgi:hypothetical protein